MNIINTAKNICEKYNIDWKFIKFLFVGGLNTAFAYSIFAFFIFIGLHYALAVFLQTVIGVTFNFFTTGRLVFKNNNNLLFIKFIMVYVFTWLLTTFILYLCNLCGYKNMYIAGFILVFPNAMISFILMKYFVFYEKK